MPTTDFAGNPLSFPTTDNAASFVRTLISPDSTVTVVPGTETYAGAGRAAGFFSNGTCIGGLDPTSLQPYLDSSTGLPVLDSGIILSNGDIRNVTNLALPPGTASGTLPSCFWGYTPASNFSTINDCFVNRASSLYAQTYVGTVNDPLYDPTSPNYQPTITNDPDLDYLLDPTLNAPPTYDASALAFQFIPSTPWVELTYVFASNEYNQYVNSQFNDIFAFLLNGQNVALLPEHTRPVAINSVNNGGPQWDNPSWSNPSHSEFYVDNVDRHLSNFLPRGMTKIMKVQAPVNQGVPNTFKLVIADTGDANLDSYVFLKFHGMRGVTKPSDTDSFLNNAGNFVCKTVDTTRARLSSAPGIPIMINGWPYDQSGTPCVFGAAADTIPDSMDNCSTVYNPTQADSLNDGRGDLCRFPGPATPITNPASSPVSVQNLLFTQITGSGTVTGMTNGQTPPSFNFTVNAVNTTTLNVQQFSYSDTSPTVSDNAGQLAGPVSITMSGNTTSIYKQNAGWTGVMIVMPCSVTIGTAAPTTNTCTLIAADNSTAYPAKADQFRLTITYGPYAGYSSGLNNSLLSGTIRATNPVVTLSLTPAASSEQAGGTHKISALALNSIGGIVINTDITFTVMAGPNRNTSGTGNTFGVGAADFTYSDAGGTGIDSVRANVGRINSNSGTVNWVSTLTLLPSRGFAPAGGSYTVTALVGPAGSASGALVTFAVVSGPNTGVTGTVTANALGVATFTYSDGSNGVGGTDQIQANTGAFQSNVVTNTWVTALMLSPSASMAAAGGSYKVAAATSPAAPGLTITFLITSGPNAGKTGTGTTDSTGTATFTYTDTNGGGGIDQIQASLGGVKSNIGSMTWIKSITLSPLSANYAVGGTDTVTAQTVPAVPGLSIVFNVIAGPNKGITGTSTTNSSGMATFTYTDANGGGTDQIQAILGTLTTATATVTWGNPQTYTLGVTNTGTGTGTVSGSGINCGSTCTQMYASSTSVTLTAAAASNSIFLGWSGACTGTGTCTVLMTGNASITATFASVSTTGRMTGGGSVFTTDGTRVTHGFELHCSLTAQSNNLEINIHQAGDSNFKLANLKSVVCYNDPSINPKQKDAGFDTIVGSGIGTYNDVAATVDFVFTDSGDPGMGDFAKITIRTGNTVVLSVAGTLTNGNQQAHNDF
jgi:hypothetical protein